MNRYRLQHLRQAFAARFELEGFLGRGAFASVYLVRNLKLRRREALKILSDSFDPGSGLAQRFAAEATVIASLDHPHIVQVYDHGEMDGMLWYSMQYIEGPTLRAELSLRQRFDPSSALQVVLPLLDALDFAHRRGVIHRDIKPGNVILNRQGRPYLMDFGMAKSEDSLLKTMTGNIVGTPAYMSPEQAEGRDLDGRADLYSIAVTLYEMLSGRLPYESEELLQLLIQRLQEEPVPLAKRLPELDPALESAVMQTLSRDPARRPATARLLHDRLLDWLGEDTARKPLRLASPAVAPQKLEPDTQPDRGRADEVGSEILPAKAAKADRATLETRLPGAPPAARIAWRGRGLRTGLALVALLLAGLGTAYWLRATVKANRDRANPEIQADERRGTEPAAPAGEPSGGEAARPRVEPPREPPGPSPAAETPGRPGPSRARVAATSEKPEPTALQPGRPPRKQQCPEPEPGPADAAACAGKVVILSLQIDAQGSVAGARALEADQPACASAAQAAARRCRFEPARDVRGEPVAGTTTIAFNFGESPP
ncbi:MAG TPA: serine/threonine-protein kinase [Thermoanaerobaculia bacterium]|nr:serine/threonine-protein kinase [Thermoanaerobaculia bacterium]